MIRPTDADTWLAQVFPPWSQRQRAGVAASYREAKALADEKSVQVDEYTVRAICDNCKRRERVKIPRGVAVCDHACPKCGTNCLRGL